MPAKVLIIDDAIHIRRLIARMLELADYSTLEASDGLQGLKILKEEKPDIVTCDISMPYMDGFQFLSAVKTDPDIKDIPIIVITAIGQEEETSRAAEMGADACLTKPFSSSHLVEIIEAQLAEKRGSGS